MLIVETPLRAIQSQRALLEHLAEQCPAFAEYTRGAIAVLDWLEHGSSLPVEQA